MQIKNYIAEKKENVYKKGKINFACACRKPIDHK